MLSPIYHAICQLLKIKKAVSISDIYQIVKDDGYTKANILDEIVNNKERHTIISATCVVLQLLTLDDNGRIVKINKGEWTRKYKELRFEMGGSYYLGLINYGADKEVRTNNAEMQKLIGGYWEGGFGDCVQVQVILYNEESQAKIAELKLPEYNEKAIDDFNNAWYNIEPSKKPRLQGK